MAIYRGPGGAGDAVNDASSETRLAVEARDAAIAAQQAAEAAESAAQSAQAAAELAETNAETAETNAETAATNAASSASSASSSASAASTSATNAASSASSASTSATNAASSASSASTSASNASTSATNAASSASSASTSATNAASSATSAASSASTATTKASEASTSATNAASSASSASSSASTATTQAGIATTKASEASTSATNAASSASSASTSATNAASSASSASTSATNASNSATAASSAQSAAEAARDAALSAYDNFDDRYLGPKASDPTLDNDGNALLSGALYFNTTTNVMKVYTGSSWVAAYVSAAGVLLTANNLSDVASVSSARTNLGVTATGSDTTYAYRANNLSDLASASTARTNLGLGTAATTAATDYATAAQGTKADTAYGWGNHASAGYLTTSSAASTYQPLDADLTAIAGLSGTSGLLKKTAANTWSLDTNTYLTSYAETDPIYTASSWYSTTNNASNWNTAYGWGNHASAGYAADSATVHKTGDETIGGTKTFSSTITGSISGNAGTVTNGVYTSGSYADPSWITSLDDGKVLPSMTSNSGKYLTTDGTNSSWAAVDALPSQTGNTGKFLTTDGSTASWATLNTDANTTTKGLYEHSNTISANYSITSGNNAMTAGTITIASGVSVTVPSGSNWVIV